MSTTKARTATVWALAILCLTPFTWASSLRVHFIDVGQADAILIQTPLGANILIDAGEKATAPSLMAYLRKEGVTKLDHVIATHPHADHIGGLASVIAGFDIGGIYMPRVTHTTKTYEDLLLAIKAKGLRVNEAKAGVELRLGEGITAQLVAPKGAGYKSLNDYSVVLRMTYGDTSFLFTGDAERVSETEMLAAGYELTADVLKVPHHGSNTSSTEPFLRAVDPTYAVIMVGQGNRYGLPHPAVLDRLKAKDIVVLRTDEHGSIVITSDGQTLEVEYPGRVWLRLECDVLRVAA